MKQTCCSPNITKDASHMAKLLKIVADENRLKILCILNNNEQCVCDIWQSIGIPQNLASHHLKILKKAGLIDFKKEGLKVIYSINKKEMSKFQTLIHNFLHHGKRN